MSLERPLYDHLTGSSVGVLAGTLAAVAHEAIGHGAGCLAVGGQITLLTSIFFKCAGATALTDASGPLGGLAFGLTSMTALGVLRPSSWTRFFLLVSSLIGVGWFAGQLVYCAVLNTDDWAFVARSLHWPSIWRLEAILTGVSAYICAARVLASYGLMRELGEALLAAAASAALAGLLWARAPLQGATEGAAAVGLAPAVLFLFRARRATAMAQPAAPNAKSWAWRSAAAAVYLLFLLGPSRGLGPLS